MRLWVHVSLDLVSSAVVERSRTKRMDTFVSNYKLTGAGFVLLLAPLYFVSASLMKYGLGIGSLFEPVEYFLSEPGR
jgi:hypothetical protein